MSSDCAWRGWKLCAWRVDNALGIDLPLEVRLCGEGAASAHDHEISERWRRRKRMEDENDREFTTDRKLLVSAG